MTECAVGGIFKQNSLTSYLNIPKIIRIEFKISSSLYMQETVIYFHTIDVIENRFQLQTKKITFNRLYHYIIAQNNVKCLLNSFITTYNKFSFSQRKKNEFSIRLISLYSHHLNLNI